MLKSINRIFPRVFHVFFHYESNSVGDVYKNLLSDHEFRLIGAAKRSVIYLGTKMQFYTYFPLLFMG